MLMLITIPLFNEDIYISKHKLDIGDTLNYQIPRFYKYKD